MYFCFGGKIEITDDVEVTKLIYRCDSDVNNASVQPICEPACTVSRYNKLSYLNCIIYTCAFYSVIC